MLPTVTLRAGGCERGAGESKGVSSVPGSCSGDEAAKDSQKGTAPHSEQLLKLPRQPQHTKPEGNAFLALELALS